MTWTWCAWLIGLAGAAAPQDAELGRLESRLSSLEATVRAREGALDQGLARVAQEVKSLREELAALARSVAVTESFLSAPPPSSDSVGVAQVAVLGPRVHVESALRHDLITLQLHRVEAEGNRFVAERFLGTDIDTVDLPLDRSAALYILSWFTADGLSFNLLLKDGATGRVAATVQVRPLQHSGQFVFVGYRLD